jgi:ATP synthase protein I
MDDSTPTPEPGSPSSRPRSPRPPSSREDRVLGPGAVEFLTLGLTVAVTLVVCAGIGFVVDRWLGTSPWFTLVGVVLGIAAAVMLTVSRVRRLL